MTAPAPSHLLRRLWLRLLATAGATLAVLVGFWSSVEDLRTPDTVPQISFGQPVEMGRTRLTPLTLGWQDGQDGPQITLRALAENVTGETQFAVFGTPARLPELRLEDAAASRPTAPTSAPQAAPNTAAPNTEAPEPAPLAPPTVTLDRDAADPRDAVLTQLHPRLPEHITLVWTLSPGWQPPAGGQPVTLRFDRQRFKLRDNLFGQASWLGFVPAAELRATLPESPAP